MQERWLAELWAKEFVDVLQMMTFRDYQSEIADGPASPSDGAIWWEQVLDAAPEAPLLIGTPVSTWLEVGKSCLRVAGVEEVDEATARSTYIEVLRQSLKGLADSLGKRFGKAIECQAGGERPESGPESTMTVVLSLDSAAMEPVYLHAPAAFFQALQPAAGASDVTSLAVYGEPAAPPEFDLLVDVEMPVSISFGRAHLPLKDVLNFGSGSVVELNRRPDDPVDVVVNNCLIARGDVVVIDGNYGVQIREIVSRQQRLMMVHN